MAHLQVACIPAKLYYDKSVTIAAIYSPPRHVFNSDIYRSFFCYLGPKCTLFLETEKLEQRNEKSTVVAKIIFENLLNSETITD